MIAITWLCAGCPATGDEIRPPPDQFYFPTGMEMAPDESVLFVANANSDLRYDSGAVSVVNLNEVDGLIGQWLEQGVPPEGRDCERDLSVPYTLVCDESEAILDDCGRPDRQLRHRAQGPDAGQWRHAAPVRRGPRRPVADLDRLQQGDARPVVRRAAPGSPSATTTTG